MFVQHSRSAALAALLAASLVVPAWPADGDLPKAGAIEAQQAAVSAPTSPAGPFLAREPVGPDVGARTAVIGESQPTRSTTGPSVGRRYAGTRAGTAYPRPVHRYSLMLGIGY